MEQFSLLDLALHFPNVFDRIASYLSLSDAGCLYKLLSTMDGFSELYDYQTYCRKQLKPIIQEANKYKYYLPRKRKNPEWNTRVCVKNQELFVMHRNNFNSPHASIRVYRNGNVIEDINITNLLSPFFNIHKFLDASLEGLEEHFMVVFLDPDVMSSEYGQYGGLEQYGTMLIPRDSDVRRKRPAYLVPDYSSYHIHGWTLWFIATSDWCVPPSSKRDAIRCHRVTLDVDENQPKPLESGEPIWETQIDMESTSEDHYLATRVGTSFAAYWFDSCESDKVSSNHVSIVRHVDGKVQTFKPPQDLHDANVEIRGDSLIMLGQSLLVVVSGNSLSSVSGIDLGALDISPGMNVLDSYTKCIIPWIEPHWLLFGIKDNPDCFLFQLIKLEERDKADLKKVTVNIKKPKLANSEEQIDHLLPLEVEDWSIHFVGRSRFCLIMKIKSKIFENALVLVQLYDSQDPIVLAPVFLKPGEIQYPTEISLSGLYEE